jgi:hypothetical protein
MACELGVVTILVRSSGQALTRLVTLIDWAALPFRFAGEDKVEGMMTKSGECRRRVAVSTGICRASLGLDGRGRPSPHEQCLALDFLEEVGGFFAGFFGVVDGDLGGFLGSLCDVLARILGGMAG